MRLILIFLLLLQVIDIAIHLATNQVEAVRVTSNLCIAAGALVGTLVAGGVARLLMVLGGLAYAALNLLFLVQHGVINPANDAIRVPMFAFVFASLALYALMSLSRR